MLIGEPYSCRQWLCGWASEQTMGEEGDLLRILVLVLTYTNHLFAFYGWGYEVLFQEGQLSSFCGQLTDYSATSWSVLSASVQIYVRNLVYGETVCC